MYKAELHCHLEGAAQPALTQRLAKKYNINTSEFLVGEDNLTYKWTDFMEFMDFTQ